jgi:CRISPR/Cas system-associated exonuclease Cas4 (RecB family)
MANLKVLYSEKIENVVLFNNETKEVEIDNYENRETEDVLDEIAYMVQSDNFSDVEIHTIIVI